MITISARHPTGNRRVAAMTNSAPSQTGRGTDRKENAHAIRRCPTGPDGRDTGFIRERPEGVPDLLLPGPPVPQPRRAGRGPGVSVRWARPAPAPRRRSRGAPRGRPARPVRAPPYAADRSWAFPVDRLAPNPRRPPRPRRPRASRPRWSEASAAVPAPSGRCCGSRCAGRRRPRGALTRCGRTRGGELRRSSRSVSQATRFRRRSEHPSRCGSAVRREAAPWWSRQVKRSGPPSGTGGPARRAPPVRRPRRPRPARQRHGAGVEGAEPVAPPLRQHPPQLGRRADRGVGDALDGLARHGARTGRDGRPPPPRRPGAAAVAGRRCRVGSPRPFP